jgi:uncharacterized protein YbaA (DUF1428 family)
MKYIDGFVAAVPQENRQAYLAHARDALSLFKDYGATRMVENWGDDASGQGHRLPPLRTRRAIPVTRTFYCPKQLSPLS